MIKITPEELVRYLYNETSEEKTAKIKAALQTDVNLRDTYEKLLGGMQTLQHTNKAPMDRTVNKVLEYAAKKQVQQVHSH